jgi:hypothetical protein
MVYVYGFCDNNAVYTVAEYQRYLPNRRIPTLKVFGVYQSFWDTGILPGVRFTAEFEVNQSVDQEVLFRRCNTCYRAKNFKKFHVTQTIVGRTLRAEGTYLYPMQRGQHLQHGDLAQRPKFWNWLNVNRRSIVTSCLLTRNSITMVSITHKIFMCGQMRILQPLRKITSNYFSVPVCGVEFWMITWLVLSSSQLVL